MQVTAGGAHKLAKVGGDYRKRVRTREKRVGFAAAGHLGDGNWLGGGTKTCSDWMDCKTNTTARR